MPFFCTRPLVHVDPGSCRVLAQDLVGWWSEIGRGPRVCWVVAESRVGEVQALGWWAKSWARVRRELGRVKTTSSVWMGGRFLFKVAGTFPPFPGVGNPGPPPRRGGGGGPEGRETCSAIQGTTAFDQINLCSVRLGGDPRIGWVVAQRFPR